MGGQNDDDLTPAQRGKLPSEDELARRTRTPPAGRVSRARSWATIAVGLIALAVLAFVLQSTR